MLAELFFDECRVPQRNILGEMNKGFYCVMHNFQGERLAAAILALAGSEKAVRDALEYGKNRTAFGQPVSTFQVWRHRFAEHLTNIEAGRWLTYRALDLLNRKWKVDRGAFFIGRERGGSIASAACHPAWRARRTTDRPYRI